MPKTFTKEDLIWSHPPDSDSSETKLTDHLENVGLNCRNISPNNHTEWNNIDFQEFCQDIGYLHDIGKLTQEFQRYIHDENQTKDDKYKNHSRLGAIITAIAIKQKYNNTSLAYSAYCIVLEHHNSIERNLGRELDVFKGRGNERMQEVIKWQIDDISEHTEEIADRILKNLSSDLNWNQCASVLENDFFEFIREIGPVREPQKNKMYYTVVSGWSTLILSDKLDAAGIYNNYEFSQNLTYDTLSSHIKSLQSEDMNRLNDLREKARTNVLDSRNRIDTSENNIYNITLETGFGKTFTGLSTALKLMNEGPEDRNIIYALPYTSIIDQVDNEIQSIFNVNPTNTEYTVHHHLSDTRSDPRDESETDSLERRTQSMLAKTWSSDITLTTFVQLFESLVGPTNNQGLKIPSLRNSIIILDEPQALSYEWWELIPELCRYLIETYDVTIISMTATQPTLFKMSGEIDDVIELVSDRELFEDYLEKNPRVNYNINEYAYEFINEGDIDSTITHKELANKLINNNKKSKMTICNTISSAETLTKCVIENLDSHNINHYVINNELEESEPVDKDGIAVAHLTTHLSPRKREEILDKIKTAIDLNREIIVISTQLIEAGVDISFESVYRDLAPLTSIVQAAGRCNRNGEINIGEVNIIRLEDPEDRDESYIPSDTVYNQGVTLISATREVLKNNGKSISEVELHSYLDIFYKTIEKDAGENEPLKDIEKYNVKKLSDYKLLSARESIDILLARTEEEKELVRTFETTKNPRKKSDLYTELEYLKISISNPSEELIEAVSSECHIIEDIGTYVLEKEYEIYHSIYGIDESNHSVENQFI